jgi:hypothetical protein
VSVRAREKSFSRPFSLPFFRFLAEPQRRRFGVFALSLSDALIRILRKYASSLTHSLALSRALARRNFSFQQDKKKKKKKRKKKKTTTTATTTTTKKKKMTTTTTTTGRARKKVEKKQKGKTKRNERAAGRFPPVIPRLPSATTTMTLGERRGRDEGIDAFLMEDETDDALFSSDPGLFWKEIDADPGDFFSFDTDYNNENGVGDAGDTTDARSSGSIVAPMSLEETTTDAYYFGTDMRVAKTPERVVCAADCKTFSPDGGDDVGGEMLFVPTPLASGGDRAVMITPDFYSRRNRLENVFQEEEAEENVDGGSSRNYLKDLAAMHGIVLRSTNGDDNVVDDEAFTEENVKTAVVAAATTEDSTVTYEEHADNNSNTTIDNKKRKESKKSSTTPTPTSQTTRTTAVSTRSISKAKEDAERLKSLASRKRWEATLKTYTAIEKTSIAEAKLQNLEEVALQQKKILKSESNNRAVRNKKRSSARSSEFSEEDVVSESLKKHAVEHVSHMSSQEEVLDPGAKKYKRKRRARQEHERRVIAKPNALLFTRQTKENIPPATAFGKVIVSEKVFDDGGEEEAQIGWMTRTRKREREERQKEKEQKITITRNSSFSTLFDDIDDCFYQDDNSTKVSPRKKKYQKKKENKAKQAGDQEATNAKVNISAIVSKGAKATDLILCSTTGQERLIGCFECGITKTPQWRQGKHGPKTLCNRCGVAYRKRQLLNQSTIF